MSIKIRQFSAISKLVALIRLYVKLGLPLPAALRAAEADLSSWHAEHRAYVHSALAGMTQLTVISSKKSESGLNE